MPTGPCVLCGATDYAKSLGGPHICPRCDCSPMARQAQEKTAQIYAMSALDLAETVFASVTDEEWRRLPTDMAENVDHYLYGAPKV